MGILLALLVILVLLLIYGIYYVTKKIDSNVFEDNVKLLRKVFNVVSFFIGLIYIVTTFISAISIIYSELVFILFIKTLIYLVLFVRIYQNGRMLIKNLESKEIFVQSNVKYIESIGKSFAYLAIIEVSAGLITQVFYFIAQISTNFMLMFNEAIFIYLAIGCLLLVVSRILHMAIQIHEENQLTI